MQALLISQQAEWRIFLEVVLARAYDVRAIPHPLDPRILRNWPAPDLIILDIDTQDICDLSVLKWFIEHRQALAGELIIISSNPALSQLDCAQRAGALAYLTKPFTYQEFQAVLPVYR